jgi:hypothetical protein
MARNFQSIQGPTDPMLRHSEIEGYQPVSRIGEVVINSFSTPSAIQILVGLRGVGGGGWRVYLTAPCALRS